MPAAARPPAIWRALSCTSPQVWRTGSCGSPVTMPVVALRALRYIFSVNLLTTASSGSPQMPRCNAPPAHRHFHVGTHTFVARLGLESVIRYGGTPARRDTRQRRYLRPLLDREFSPSIILSNS